MAMTPTDARAAHDGELVDELDRQVRGRASEQWWSGSVDDGDRRPSATPVTRPR